MNERRIREALDLLDTLQPRMAYQAEAIKTAERVLKDQLPERENEAYFSLDDLENGMFVKCRDGERGLFLDGYLIGLDRAIKVRDYYNKDLTYANFGNQMHPYDICYVYEINIPHSITTVLEYGEGLLTIWRRPKSDKGFDVYLSSQEAIDKLNELTGKKYRLK